MPENILTIRSSPRIPRQPGYNPAEPVEVFVGSWFVSNSWKKTDLVPNWVIWSTAESGLGRAQLTHRYGERFRSGDAGDPGFRFSRVPPVNYHLQFVKIVVGGSGLTKVGEIESYPPGGSLFRRVWVGQIDAQAAALTGSSHQTPTGVQLLAANSIEEAVFGKHFVLESEYREFNLSPDDPDTEIDESFTAKTKTCRHGITFNENGLANQDGIIDEVERKVIGLKRFATRPGRGHHRTPGSGQIGRGPVTWSTRDIVEYAIANWTAEFASNPPTKIFTVEIDKASLARLPNWDAPVLETHGYRPLEILRRLLSRRRLLVWWLEMDENKLDASGRPTLWFRVQTTTSTPVSIDNPVDSLLGRRQAIPANDRWLALDVQSDASARVQLEHDANSQTDQVVAQGARQRNVMTLAFETPGTAQEPNPEPTHRGAPYWFPEMQAAYELGASKTAAYRALRLTDRDEKKRLNDAERARDKYKDVFRRFGMSYDPGRIEYPNFSELYATWANGISYSVGDLLEHEGVVYVVMTSSGGTDLDATSPLDDKAHTYKVFADLYANCFGNLRLLQKLPLLENHDYSGANIINGTTANPLITATPPNELDMFVLFWIENKKIGTDEIEGRYIFGEKLSQLGLNPPKIEEDRDWSTSVRVVEDDTSFIVNVQGTKTRPHTIAKGTFIPLIDQGFTVWSLGQTYSIGQIVLGGTTSPGFFQVTGGAGPSAGNDSDLAGGSDTGYSYKLVTKPAASTIDEEDEGKVDWRKMLATICYEDDRFCESIYPVNPVGLADNNRVLRLDLGDEYRLDWVQPGTIVDLTEEGTVVDSLGGYIRDDRKKLEEIARRAYSFYSKIRGVLHLTADYRSTMPPAGREFVPGLVLGTLISKIRNGSIDVNSPSPPPEYQPVWQVVDSVITEVRVDFPYVESETPITAVGRVTMSLKTSFGELDPRFFVQGGKVTRGGRVRV